MSRSWSLVLPLIVFATTASAQLTPEQRAERERAPSPMNSTTLSESWERRSLDGDPTAYFGASAGEERRQRDLRWRLERERYRAAGSRLETGTGPGAYRPTASELRDHWFTIGQRGGAPRALRRAPVGQMDVRADLPLALTLASPIGAPGRALMIRTLVTALGSQDGWTRMGEVTADEQGNYRVEIPALHAGTYDLQIEVYDPDVPEIPYSASQSRLIAWVP